MILSPKKDPSFRLKCLLPEEKQLLVDVSVGYANYQWEEDKAIGILRDLFPEYKGHLEGKDIYDLAKEFGLDYRGYHIFHGIEF